MKVPVSCWTAAEATRNLFWLNQFSGRFIFSSVETITEKAASRQARGICAAARRGNFCPDSAPGRSLPDFKLWRPLPIRNWEFAPRRPGGALFFHGRIKQSPLLAHTGDAGCGRQGELWLDNSVLAATVAACVQPCPPVARCGSTTRLPSGTMPVGPRKNRFL